MSIAVSVWCMRRTAAPTAMAISIPEPSSRPSETASLPSCWGAHCSTMRSLSTNPPVASTTPPVARYSRSAPNSVACTPTTRPSSTMSERTLMSHCRVTPAFSAVATSASMRTLPAKLGAGGRCPRAAGLATEAYGSARSPIHIRPESSPGIQVGVSQSLWLNTAPWATSQSWCSTAPLQ